MIKGFDSEFSDLDQYIRVITDRIWEGRRIDDINKYYSEGCAVETPSSVSIGVKPVVDGTRATLKAFPDRRLLAEEIIISGSSEYGFLSSHRIFSPMTHAGLGVFGRPTNKIIYARTIADCVCINNQIVHEWLVRDQAAIARQIGSNEREMAQNWLNLKGEFKKESMPSAPSSYVSQIDNCGDAQKYGQLLGQVFHAEKSRQIESFYSEEIISALPGGEAAVGKNEIQYFWKSIVNSINLNSFQIEHLVANTRPQRPTIVAARWRVQGSHDFDGRYGKATGKPVEILGITHAEFQDGYVFREWHLIDDVAVWMQVLDPRK